MSDDEDDDDAPEVPGKRAALSEIVVVGLPPEKPVARRLFVGVRISIATANTLGQLVETLARRTRDHNADVRWVAPANYHVTLAFLGWTRSEVVEAIRDSLLAACADVQPFTLKTATLGAFPAIDKASIVWAGVQAPELAALADKVGSALADLGFPRETRSFHPHVTLGRLRETRSLKEAVLPVSEQMFGDTRIDSITLFESETKSTGSVYREVARIGFAEAAATAERQTRAVHLGASTASSDSRGPSVDLDRDDDTDDGWPRGQGPI